MGLRNHRVHRDLIDRTFLIIMPPPPPQSPSLPFFTVLTTGKLPVSLKSGVGVGVSDEEYVHNGKRHVS